MAASRLERLGTVFSRVTALLRSGAMKRDDKPIWYDVYQVFPPKCEPSYAKRRPQPEIQEILYPEDSVRAKFHKKMHKKLPMEDLLQEPTNDLTRRAIDSIYDMMQKDQTLSEDQAVDRVIETFKQEGLVSAPKLSRHSRRSREFEKAKGLLDESTTRFSQNDQRVVKDISDKNIDVSKYLKDD